MSAGLIARVKRLESHRVGNFRLVELILDTITGLSEPERAFELAACRARWPRGPRLEQLVLASYESLAE